MAENFFRKIENPNEVRRKVLESSKETIHTLKGYQKIVDIREKRRNQVRKLNIQLKEINMFVDKLKDAFPSELLAKLEKENKQEKSKTKKGKKKGKAAAKKKTKNLPEPSEVTKLENTLSDIEDKLKRLG